VRGLVGINYCYCIIKGTTEARQLSYSKQVAVFVTKYRPARCYGRLVCFIVSNEQFCVHACQKSVAYHFLFCCVWTLVFCVKSNLKFFFWGGVNVLCHKYVHDNPEPLWNTPLWKTTDKYSHRNNISGGRQLDKFNQDVRNILKVLTWSICIVTELSIFIFAFWHYRCRINRVEKCTVEVKYAIIRYFKFSLLFHLYTCLSFECDSCLDKLIFAIWCAFSAHF